ncbi:protein ANTAGONIST OF LIKE HETEROCHROMATIN PROTEIN 1-like [Phragmites australis]|uniref:protein ANTAGONIST OF LIKE HETEROCHROMATIN PROTEIN 1-like n=1 Tax=Phragmites australis TaxID=29695 RepID=UPI002D79E1AB|nr:protein ANTAGONIST OF LIKE HETEROCHROMATIN PROTEIN 1-like [Phragmites australis]
MGNLGLIPLQKMIAAIRQLAYGVSSDAVDEYVGIGASTAMLALRKFVQAIVEVFGDEYLRAPNEADTARLLAEGERRGFPGMLGSIDCMHWVWKNYPKVWHGTYTGYTRKPSIVLEAVASYDLWIWHAFFGMPGSLNDINILHRSNLFTRLTDGTAPTVSYSINGNRYDMRYYLGDGIYPEWAAIVKAIPTPRGNKSIHFSAMQAAVRKDVEHAFSVLQARFAIVRGPARVWDQSTLHNIMTACVIMHNMIIEDERGSASTVQVFDYRGEQTQVHQSADEGMLHYV